MNFRKDTRDALVAAISLACTSATVSRWKGQEYLFNRDLDFPSIFVAYDGFEAGPDLELGDATVTYERTLIFQVYFLTTDTASSQGDEEAFYLLQQAEEALQGSELSDGWYLEMDYSQEPELLLDAWQDQYLYRQTWRVSKIVTR